MRQLSTFDAFSSATCVIWSNLGYLPVTSMLHSEASRESGTRSALEYLALHPINRGQLDHSELTTVWNALVCDYVIYNGKK